MIFKNAFLFYFTVKRCGSELDMGICTFFEPNQIKRIYSFSTRTNSFTMGNENEQKISLKPKS